jgi:DNA-binding NarL/FixJ family response regulator
MVDKPGTADLKDHQPAKGLIDPSAGREITHLLGLGNSVREIAEQVNLSKSVVGRFVRPSLGTSQCPTHNTHLERL